MMLSRSIEEGVVSIGDSGQGVDLEVFIWPDLRNLLDGTPVGEGGLGIVEPLVAQLFNMVVIDVGDSLGDFASGQSSSESQDILSDFLVQNLGGIVGH